MKLYIISAWSILDPVYYTFTRLQYLKQTEKKKTIFRVRLTRYKGREVVLSDGTIIKKNDTLVKIHLHNVQLLKELYNINNDIKRAVVVYKKIKESLPYLASYVEQHKKKEQIKGIIGITMLNRGSERLGFESFSITSRLYIWFKQLALFPIFLISSSNPARQKNKSPNYLFMSTKSLLGKYGKV
ncbi:hypothetical protein IC621_10475 [Bacillus sp. IB182487]|uniref:YkoP-like domain-containing protein n=2 Tax=Metabacillus arenae TaxID=2771434 RepID=A0A926NBW1_9BACI|nr:hypothetical protein [Metabacillus arenae]